KKKEKNTMKKARMGGVYQPHYKDRKTGEKVVLPTWWIYYNSRGKQVKESSHSTKESDAWKLLKKRHGEIAAGKPVGSDVNKTNFEDLAAMIVADYKVNGRRSLSRLEGTLHHLRGYFGLDRGVDITTDRITAYTALRLDEGAARGTVDQDLATISRMFTLGVRAGKVSSKPYVARLKVNN